jgi:hypothetical protein
MKLLLHICCAPCLIYPLEVLTREGHALTGCFYNPNIHPSLEYLKRLETLRDYAGGQGLRVIWPERYDMEEFLRRVAGSDEDRCGICYEMRLRHAAETAGRLACDAFSTTLLYSKYQKHDRIREIGERLGSECGVPFYYRDFREGWSRGVKASKQAGLYRQQYCGCIYSEKERFFQAPDV